VNDRVDPVGNDADPLGGHARELDDLDSVNSETATIASADAARASGRASRTGDASAGTPRAREDREVVHGDDGRHASARGPRNVVQCRTSSPRLPAEPHGYHSGIPTTLDDAARATEREKLEVDARTVAQRAEQPANDARRPGARLDERRRVDADPSRRRRPRAKRVAEPSREAMSSTAVVRGRTSDGESSLRRPSHRLPAASASATKACIRHPLDARRVPRLGSRRIVEERVGRASDRERRTLRGDPSLEELG
jgi:hypothetical protein